MVWRKRGVDARYRRDATRRDLSRQIWKARIARHPGSTALLLLFTHGP